MEYLASIIGNFFLYALLLISLNNFIVGKTSIWSIGHMAFFGIGALATGILSYDFALSGWTSLFIGLLIGCLLYTSEAETV